MQFTTNGTFRSGLATNDDNGDTFSIVGMRGSSTIFSGDNILTGSNDSEAMIYDLTLNGTQAFRFQNVTIFDLGGGNDLLDLTSSRAQYGGQVTATGGAGNDTIWLGSNGGTAYGEAQSAITLLGAGSDDIVGSTVQDTIYGDFQSLSATRLLGADVIKGEGGTDTLVGDVGSVASGVTLTFAADTIDAGEGQDTVAGDAMTGNQGMTGAADQLFGGDSDDTIYGDWSSLNSGSGTTLGGADVIEGGAGNDQLWGDGPANSGQTVGISADRFVFDPGSNNDTIHDFQGEGVAGGDVIDLTGYASVGVHSLADITITVVGNDTRLGTQGDQLLVQNTVSGGSTTLTAGDFLFA